jgi:maltooligosyltrehalose trehalohydrolase
VNDRRLGATIVPDEGCSFEVWAPNAERVEVHLLDPVDEYLELEPSDRGYFHATVRGVGAGARYRFRLDGDGEFADPASRFQPDGVHGPSEVFDPAAFAWTDLGFNAPAFAEQVLYELHVGTYTEEGTFDAAASRLEELRELGVTTVEIMPIAEFPGSRNWGYDGVFPYAAESGYGGPAAFQRFVDRAHALGLGVFLDVVYNHLGPEGNVLPSFGPYFSGKYRTPWGEAVNVDDGGSDEVRRYFTENGLRWLEEFHVDGLRLDAIHAIVDTSARPFLAEVPEAVQELSQRIGRRLFAIAETPENDTRTITPRDLGGQGFDALWSDGFHHAVHAYATGEREGYYMDYGTLEQVAQALAEGWVFSGQYSRFWGRRHGSSPRPASPDRFLVYNQNHDQIGNRMNGERLSTLVPSDVVKLMAGVALLSPYVPMLFMGEEYGETSPFQYFVSHQDAELVEAVRRGRAEEFRQFTWAGDPPDPQSEETFARSKLDRSLREKPAHAGLLKYHRALIALRRSEPALATATKDGLETWADSGAGMLRLRRRVEAQEAVAFFNFGADDVTTPLPEGVWTRALDSAEERFAGPGTDTPGTIEALGTELTVPAKRVLLYLREGTSLA